MNRLFYKSTTVMAPTLNGEGPVTVREARKLRLREKAQRCATAIAIPLAAAGAQVEAAGRVLWGTVKEVWSATKENWALIIGVILGSVIGKIVYHLLRGE